MSNRAKKSVIYWLLLSPLVVIILFPYAVMLSTALKPSGEIRSFPPSWIPDAPRLQNFIDMWDAANFGTSLLNSLIVSGLATMIAIALAIPAAYAMARYRFRGQGLYRQFLLVTQMLSPIVLVVGIFRLMASVGLVDTLASLIIAYSGFFLAFAVWLMQSYFSTIPLEVEEAAWVDGAGRWKTLLVIFLPMAVPAIVVTAIFTFINSYNEFVLALTLLRSSDNYTLPLQVYSLVGGRYRIEWEHVMAATLVATIPVAVVFAWVQRYLIRGLSLGAVK